MASMFHCNLNILYQKTLMLRGRLSEVCRGHEKTVWSRDKLNDISWEKLLPPFGSSKVFAHLKYFVVRLNLFKTQFMSGCLINRKQEKAKTIRQSFLYPAKGSEDPTQKTIIMESTRHLGSNNKTQRLVFWIFDIEALASLQFSALMQGIGKDSGHADSLVTWGLDRHLAVGHSC